MKTEYKITGEQISEIIQLDNEIIDEFNYPEKDIAFEEIREKLIKIKQILTKVHQK